MLPSPLCGVSGTRRRQMDSVPIYFILIAIGLNVALLHIPLDRIAKALEVLAEKVKVKS